VNAAIWAGTITANWRFDQMPISVKIDGNPISTSTDKLGAFIGMIVKPE